MWLKSKWLVRTKFYLYLSLTKVFFVQFAGDPLIVPSKFSNTTLISIRFASPILTYSFMFINFPMEANDKDETDEVGFIDPNKALALTTSFILGFSDSCFNTQVDNLSNNNST